MQHRKIAKKILCCMWIEMYLNNIKDIVEICITEKILM